MNPVIILFFLAFIKCVICDGTLLVACDLTDLDCLGQSTKLFLEKTSRGIKQYDIHPIDPLFIPSLNVLADEDMPLSFHFKNVSVTGLKNQKIYDFRIDTKTKSVVLKTKADLSIIGEIVIELGEEPKFFSGVYTAQATSVGAATYGYDLKTDNAGILHFEVGPESINCESIDDLKVLIDPDLENDLLKDPQAKANKPAFEAKKTIIRQKTICKMVELCYVDIVHNIRAAAKVLPASAFFRDVTKNVV